METYSLAAGVLSLVLLLVAQPANLHRAAGLPGIFEESYCEDHDHGLVPSFTSPENGTLIEAFQGTSALLPCTVSHLGSKVVSWIRKTDEDLQLLTVGGVSHTADTRLESDYIYPNQWRLRINKALTNDSGVYLCHVSTEEPRFLTIYFNVSVPDPVINLVDAEGHVINADIFYESGSSIELRCQVQQIWTLPEVFQWMKSGRKFADNLWRGGLSLRNEVQPGMMSSVLNIVNATSGDSGNYSCVINTLTASVMVHILQGENRAAMQHAVNGSSTSGKIRRKILFVLLILTKQIYCS